MVIRDMTKSNLKVIQLPSINNQKDITNFKAKQANEFPSIHIEIKLEHRSDYYYKVYTDENMYMKGYVGDYLIISKSSPTDYYLINHKDWQTLKQ